MKFWKKPFAYAAVFALVLVCSTAYLLLEVFVIPHGISTVQPEPVPDTATTVPAGTEPVVTADSYTDEHISLTITTLREYDTDIYVADVRLTDAAYLKTALAEDTYGTNVTQKTSDIAAAHKAIFAVNGDYYGANGRGYVIKNGVLYRDSVRNDNDYDDLVVYQDGTFGIVNEAEISAQQLIEDGVQQLFAFGPALVQDEKVVVSFNEEVKESMESNPRTAVGIIEPLHYVFIVSDGRTSRSAGLSLYELAQMMKKQGCTTAYNLDGGGSATMWFNGEVVNKPTTNGKGFGERAVSDIVYIGA